MVKMHEPLSPRKLKVRRSVNGTHLPENMDSPGKKVRKIRMRIKCGEGDQAGGVPHFSKTEILKILKDEQSKGHLSPKKKKSLNEDKSVGSAGTFRSLLSMKSKSSNAGDSQSHGKRRISLKGMLPLPLTSANDTPLSPESSPRRRRSFLQGIMPSSPSVCSNASGNRSRPSFRRQMSSHRSIFSALTFDNRCDDDETTRDVSSHQSLSSNESDGELAEMLSGLLKPENDASAAHESNGTELSFPESDFEPPNFIVIPKRRKEEELIFDEEHLRMYRQEGESLPEETEGDSKQVVAPVIPPKTIFVTPDDGCKVEI